MQKIFLKQGLFSNRPSKDSNSLDLTQEIAKFLTTVGLYNNYDCCKGVSPVNGSSLIWDGTLGKYVSGSGGGGALSNLGYTASPLNGVIINSNGTGFTIPLVNATNAGLATPAMFSALSSSTPTNAQLGVGNTYVSVVDPATGAINFVIDGVTTMTLSSTKLSLNGILIDPPSGLELMLKATNPGGIQANTLWLNSTTNHLMRGNVDLETLGGSVKFVLPVLLSDWVLTGTDAVIDIPYNIHGKIKPIVSIRELIGNKFITTNCRVEIENITNNITIIVNNNAIFAGEIVIS